MWWNKKQQREQLACAASLAGALLAVTADRPMREYFRAERCECRRLLRRAVRPRYVESGAAKQDLAWLREVLGEVNEFALEVNDQPEGYSAGWGNTYFWPSGAELAEAVR